jgi:HEPN domain-containing protein
MNPDPRIRLLQQWVERAEEDLITAEYTLTLEENCPFSTVCFHSQQCAEKYLKALLVWLDVNFPRTHDLMELLPRVPAEAGLGLQIADLGSLNRYAVETRYPGEWEPITRPEAVAAVAVANHVRNAVRPLLPAAAFPQG